MARPPESRLARPLPVAPSRRNGIEHRESIASAGFGSNEARGLAVRGRCRGTFPSSVAGVSATRGRLSPASH